MRIANIICSFNSAPLTERVYKQMKGQVGDLYVVENSTEESKLFRCPGMKDLGRTNKGFGGMNDYIFSLPQFRQYDFVGILNNDIFDIPPNSVRKLSEYMTPDVGMLSPSISDVGTGWTFMRRKAWEGIREVPHVETIATWFNVRHFEKLCRFIPYEYFGILDISLSMLYKKAGYKLVVSDDFSIGHLLSGARDMAGVKDKYLEEHSESQRKWFAAHPELQVNYDEYFRTYG